MNSASLSTNFSMSHGHATRSTRGCSRVIHFIVFSSSPVTAVYDLGCGTLPDDLQRRRWAVGGSLVPDRDRADCGVLLRHAERLPELGLIADPEEHGTQPRVDRRLQNEQCGHPDVAIPVRDRPPLLIPLG